MQQNTDNILAVLRFNIMTFYHKGQCSVLNGVMYLCCGPCNASTPSDGRFDIASLPGSMWQTIGFLSSNVIPINPTAAIQAFEGPQWYFSQWKKYIISENWCRCRSAKGYMQYIREMPRRSSKWDHFYQEKLSLSCQISSIPCLRIYSRPFAITEMEKGLRNVCLIQ